MEKKIVIARIRVKEGKEKEYLSLISPLIEATKAEKGNLSYTLYQDVKDSCEFIVYEEYVNEKAFHTHCNTEVFLSIGQKIQGLLAKELDIQVF